MTPHSEVLLVDVLTTWITKRVALVPRSHALILRSSRPFEGYLTGQFNLGLNMSALCWEHMSGVLSLSINHQINLVNVCFEVQLIKTFQSCSLLFLQCFAWICIIDKLFYFKTLFYTLDCPGGNYFLGRMSFVPIIMIIYLLRPDHAAQPTAKVCFICIISIWITYYFTILWISTILRTYKVACKTYSDVKKVCC